MDLNGSCKIQTRTQWNTSVVEANSESVSEERGKKHVIFEVSGTAPDENEVKVRKHFEIDEARYSSFKKLLRVTAYVHRIINYKNRGTVNSPQKYTRMELLDYMEDLSMLTYRKIQNCQCLYEDKNISQNC